MSARLVAYALAAALPLASTAHAQQIPASRLARPTAAALGAPAIVPGDSVARYARAGYTQRWTGTPLLVAGLTTVAASYAQFIHSGRMGMNGGQLATLAAGAGVGTFGATRLRASRESYRMAARWNALASGTAATDR